MLKVNAVLLTKGQFAYVDGEDYEWLSEVKWQATWAKTTRTFYARRLGKVSMHRAIWERHNDPEFVQLNFP